MGQNSPAQVPDSKAPEEVHDNSSAFIGCVVARIVKCVFEHVLELSQ